MYVKMSYNYVCKNVNSNIHNSHNAKIKKSITQHNK